jgi:hypothetical protein
VKDILVKWKVLRPASLEIHFHISHSHTRKVHNRSLPPPPVSAFKLSMAANNPSQLLPSGSSLSLSLPSMSKMKWDTKIGLGFFVGSVMENMQS